MHCPFCGHEETVVKDSRPSEDGASIRRRRACPSCGGRFTTFERIQLRDLTVVKTDGRKEMLERDKIKRSLSVALRKRPVSEDQIERSANGIVRQLEALGDNEIASDLIGDYVMKALTQLDVVGYIRYASVYKDFRHTEDFNEFLEALQDARSAHNKE